MVFASWVGDSSAPMFAEGKQGFPSQGYSTYFSKMPHEFLFLAKYTRLVY